MLSSLGKIEVDFFDYYCWKLGIGDSRNFLVSHQGQELLERILSIAPEKHQYGVYLAILRRDIQEKKLMLDLNYKFGLKNLMQFNYPRLITEFVLEGSKKDRWNQSTIFSVLVMLLKKRQLELRLLETLLEQNLFDVNSTDSLGNTLLHHMLVLIGDYHDEYCDMCSLLLHKG